MDLERLYQTIAQECGVSPEEVKKQIEMTIQEYEESNENYPVEKKRSVEDFIDIFTKQKE